MYPSKPEYEVEEEEKVTYLCSLCEHVGEVPIREPYPFCIMCGTMDIIVDLTN